MNKLTPEKIMNVLDHTLITSYKTHRLYYLHSGVRGYYYEDRRIRRITFLSGNMNDACTKWNNIIDEA